MSTVRIDRKIIKAIDGSVLENTMDYCQLIEELERVPYAEYYRSIGGREAKSDSVEHGNFPHFVDVFYGLYSLSRHVPTLEYVCEAYKYVYCQEEGNGNVSVNQNVVPQNMLFGRICRAYCSWCRELTILYSLFAELPLDYEVYYDLEKDKHGVDIVVKHNNKTFNIHSYLNSRGSHTFRKYKDLRHGVEEDGYHIDVVSNFENTSRVGSIDVHTPDVAKEILCKIKEIEEQAG